MTIKKGNQVEIICGKDKGKKGEVIEILRKQNRVKVKGINMIKKHEKVTKEKKGGIISKENFLSISNVKVARWYCPNSSVLLTTIWCNPTVRLSGIINSQMWDDLSGVG